MRFQVMSDLHLEVGQQYSSFNIPPCAPYLILAGDIGRLHDYESLVQFLASQCNKFERVFFVPGNHEFYGDSRAHGLERVRQLQKDPRLRQRLSILNRTRIELSENITILGCTLQSFISASCEQIVTSKIQDFRRIADWTTASHNDEHERDVNWLKAQVEYVRAIHGPETPRKIIVITHHAPIRQGSSNPQHEQNPWTDAFATELLNTGEGEAFNPLQSVNWWIFGHTHFTTSLVREGVALLSNQRGYVLPGQETAREPGMIEASTIGSGCEPKKSLLEKIVGPVVFFRKPNFYQRQEGHSRKVAVNTIPERAAEAQIFDVRKHFDV